jgi:hypothetical protein
MAEAVQVAGATLRVFVRLVQAIEDFGDLILRVSPKLLLPPFVVQFRHFQVAPALARPMLPSTPLLPRFAAPHLTVPAVPLLVELAAPPLRPALAHPLLHLHVWPLPPWAPPLPRC